MIEIKITADNALEMRRHMEVLLGKETVVGGTVEPIKVPTKTGEEVSEKDAEPTKTYEPAPEAAEDIEEPRVYGVSGPTTSRRTKVEMAEDAEIEKLCGRLGIQSIPTDVPASELLADLRTRVENDDIPIKPGDLVEPSQEEGQAGTAAADTPGDPEKGTEELAAATEDEPAQAAEGEAEASSEAPSEATTEAPSAAPTGPRKSIFNFGKQANAA